HKTEHLAVIIDTTIRDATGKHETTRGVAIDGCEGPDDVVASAFRQRVGEGNVEGSTRPGVADGNHEAHGCGRQTVRIEGRGVREVDDRIVRGLRECQVRALYRLVFHRDAATIFAGRVVVVITVIRGRPVVGSRGRR